MEYMSIQYSVEDAVATITLDRPSALNALNQAMIKSLDQILDAIAGDHDVRAVIITGAGERAFAAGADIREFTTLEDVTAATALAATTHAIFEKIGRLTTACHRRDQRLRARRWPRTRARLRYSPGCR